MEVLSLAARRLLRLGQERHRLAPAMTALLPATHAPSCGLERSLRFAAPARMEEARAIAERSEGFSAEVNAGFLSGRKQWLSWHIGAGDADIPAIRLPANRDGLGHALQRTVQADTDTAKLRQAEETTIQRRPTLLAHLRIGAAGGAVAPLKARVSRCLARLDATAERLEGAVDAERDIL
jgi:hypothetical protein